MDQCGTCCAAWLELNLIDLGVPVLKQQLVPASTSDSRQVGSVVLLSSAIYVGCIDTRRQMCVVASYLGSLAQST